jgi:Tol biopolymer transport system component
MIALHTTSTFHLYLAPVGDLNSARSLAAARSFAFSPDGKIVYSSDDNDIWTINRDGGEQRQLTNSSFPDSNPLVSPDGRYIFFCSSRSGSNHIWRMNADGSNQIQLTHLEGGGHRMSVSPDQRWIYFESGIHRNIWKVSSEGGEEIPISDETVYQSALSPDGKLMAYFSRIKDGDNRYRIAVMSLETGKVVKTFALADDKSTPVVITWATAGRGFDYVIQAGSSALWRQSLDQDHPRFMADLGSEDYNDFALSPDGNFVGFIRGRWILGAVLVEGLK